MFTGLIEYIAKVTKSNAESGGLLYSIECGLNFNEIEIGDSIAINGVCQSVVDKNKGLTFFAMNKTLDSVIPFKGFVNVERALCLNSRLGGHFVSGHVDECLKINSIYQDGQAKIFRFNSTNEFIIPKGSVAINGVSLTVCNVCSDGFEVSVLPQTLNSTNLQYLRSYDLVNVEYDIIAKYLQKFCSPEQTITKEFLIQNGF